MINRWFNIKNNKQIINDEYIEILGVKYDIETTISLYLENNQLTSIPDLSKLVNLKYLYLYNNELTSIPDLSKLVNLKYLYLENNKLTSIPDLSKLVNLIRLYLENNQLTENEINKIIKMLPNCIVCG